ncbi:hypothetical protein [Paenibacillus amylolyticus]|uniref:hypothetical protein n=1 Tax=Paenibacillus amylolyticus TaxID=1451 RepID=UPI003D36C7FA
MGYSLFLDWLVILISTFLFWIIHVPQYKGATGRDKIKKSRYLSDFQWNNIIVSCQYVCIVSSTSLYPNIIDCC